LRRELGHLTQGWTISILGTDLNRQFLMRAAEGRFEEWSFRGTPLELREECFEKYGDCWRIKSRFREGVTFAHHNLVDTAPPCGTDGLPVFDLILCRNVLIYFAADVVERVVSRLAASLVDGGWLAVGHAEQCDQLRTEFRMLAFPRASLYQKSRQTPEAPDSASNAERRLVPPFISDLTARDLRPIDPLRLRGRRTSHLLAGGASTVPRDQATAQRPSARCAVDLARVRSLADAGRLDAALDLCRALIAKDRLNPQHYFYFALLCDGAGAFDDAAEALQRAIYLDRNFVLAHYHLGLTHLRRCQRRKAANSFRNVRKLLAQCTDGDHLPGVDGLTAAQMEELTRMHANVLEES
jgi:chemotaxis protein methyltransferase CheR